MRPETRCLETLAPAKINLCLHVTGRRADGYHLLDSLVVFAGVGDLLQAVSAEALSLAVAGPFAAGLGGGPDNLVLRAARLTGVGAAITLHKRLPVAAGIGGGSADAAATLRLMAAMGGAPVSPKAVLALGADVPVCLDGRAVRMRGIGEVIEPLPMLPPVWLVLVNPGMPVPTGSVFAALARRDNAGLPDIPAGGWPDAAALTGWLGGTRNDLEPPALALAPEVGAVLAALGRLPGCRLARMSGSGGTCFGIFATAQAAAAGATRLRADHPGWWIAPAPVLAGPPAVTAAQDTRSTT